MAKQAKLVITIPCFNEEKGLPLVLESIPKKIQGMGKIEIVVIDDGSTDRTAGVAEKYKAQIVNHKRNLGLARSFEDGIKKALSREADIIVNTDGDNQYNQKEIPKLIGPILKQQADMVLGDRQIKKLKHMPWGKKIGNLFGSWVVRKLTGSRIQDASTGFRAFTKELAISFILISNHTYTHETIIHSILNGFRVVEIPVDFKKRRFGQSRLIKGIWSHIWSSAVIIVRTVLIYSAFKYLALTGSGIMLGGVIGTLRFIWFFLNGKGSGHIQSLIFSSILISVGFNVVVMGILADLIGINRKIVDDMRKRFTGFLD